MATLSYTPALPGPRLTPVLGYQGNLIRFFRDPIAYMRRAYTNYGPICGMSNRETETIFAFGPEYNRQVLTNPDLFHSPSFLLFPTPPDSAARRLDAGLISMNGPYHRQQRKLIMPAFHKKHVETYRDDMVAITQRFLDSWRSGQLIDIDQEMQRLTLSVASQTLFGLDATQDAGRTGETIKRWLNYLTAPEVLFFPYRLPGMPYTRALAHAERMEANLKAMIARKRSGNLAAQRDVIAMLIQARDEEGQGLNDAELIGQANVLFTAGHETSANTLTWTLFLLAQHPQVAADLHDELTSVLGGDAPTVEQLARLPLLERVIKESMRLLPPAVYTGRYSTAPFQMGPYRLPAEQSVVISHYITHHMPQLYPHPERFNPNRWLSCDPSPYEYLPFSAGPRMCIGATFAMMEIKIVLAMLLQRYRLTLRPNAQIDRRVTVTLTPKYGMPMLVAPQDRCFVRNPVRGNIHEMVEL